MAGYDGHSKSNNAVEAEREGRFPLSRAARRAGVPAELVKRFVGTSEWHHSSKFYNRVDYYDVAEIRQVFGLDPAADFEINPEAAAALAAWKPAKADAAIHHGCTVEWIEWSGTRNYPRADERRAENCTIAIKGQTATITLPDGATLTKRLKTRGFKVTTADGRSPIWN